MATYLSVGETDDPFFIECLDRLVHGITDAEVPNQLWLVKIDNWFDHRWLQFSGIGSVNFPLPALGIGEHGALDEFQQDKLTFPPFSPNRVLGQWSFVRHENTYEEQPLVRLPHSPRRQASSKNLQRRVGGFADSAVSLWYSANTVANGRGSVMMYTVAGGQTEAWYASLVRAEVWRLQSTKGVSREQMLHLLGTPS